VGANQRILSVDCDIINFQWHQWNCGSNTKDITANLLREVSDAASDSFAEDIFSFGAVLYEMLSGKRAFKRDTAADTMAAILNDDLPELLESERQIPPALDRIVRHCLEKAPEQRFQSARDLAFDLESITTLTASGSLSAAKVKERRRWLFAILKYYPALTGVSFVFQRERDLPSAPLKTCCFDC
jgi:serine/threonine protein kinase